MPDPMQGLPMNNLVGSLRSIQDRLTSLSSGLEDSRARGDLELVGDDLGRVLKVLESLRDAEVIGKWPPDPTFIIRPWIIGGYCGPNPPTR